MLQTNIKAIKIMISTTVNIRAIGAMKSLESKKVVVILMQKAIEDRLTINCITQTLIKGLKDKAMATTKNNTINIQMMVMEVALKPT